LPRGVRGGFGGVLGGSDEGGREELREFWFIWALRSSSWARRVDISASWASRCLMVFSNSRTRACTTAGVAAQSSGLMEGGRSSFVIGIMIRQNAVLSNLLGTTPLNAYDRLATLKTILRPRPQIPQCRYRVGVGSMSFLPTHVGEMLALAGMCYIIRRCFYQ
jgi:hypothetical protein